MIQFWTNGTKEATVGVLIRNNRLDRGAGDWTQSIFMRNEEVDRKRAGREMYYRDVVITGNLIRNSHAHGITVGETTRLSITQNTLLQASDSPRVEHVTVPAISVSPLSEEVEVERNVGARMPKPSTGWAMSDNLIIQRNFPRAKNYYGSLFTDALATGQVSLHQLQFLPRVAAESLGSPLTRFNPRPNQTVLFVVSRQLTGGITGRHELSLGGAYGPNGQEELTGADVTWYFPDGGRAFGRAIEREFPKGENRVEVSARLASGIEVRSMRTIISE
jgi:hypothetical protein